MSIPKVSARLVTPDGPEPKQAGAIFFVHGLKAKGLEATPENYEIVGMQYACPCGCGHRGYLGFKNRGNPEPRTDHWTWSGDMARPTLEPSILHKIETPRGDQVHWHGHLRDGLFETLPDSTAQPK